MAAKVVSNKQNSKPLVENSTENVIFACTTLKKNSTISKHFGIINKNIRELIDSDIKINPFFIYKPPYGAVSDLTIDDNILQLLKDNNYNIGEYNLYKENIIDYLNSADIKFKIIVLSQCSDLVSTLTDETQQINEKIFETIFDNLYTFYNKISDNGYIINYFYDQTNSPILTNIESFYSAVTIVNKIIYFLYSIIIFKILFNEIRTGIYQKINKIDIRLNLIIPSVLLLEYLLLKKIGDSIISSQFCLTLIEYSNKL